MWGSVVHWMRAAVDFVGLDGMPVAEPSSKGQTAPSSKLATSSPERVSHGMVLLSTRIYMYSRIEMSFTRNQYPTSSLKAAAHWSF